MLCKRACSMLQELNRSAQDDIIPEYDSESVNEVIRECHAFFDLNQRDLSEMTDRSAGSQRALAVQIRHNALLRNRRCLMAYMFKRLELIQRLRLEFGTVLPANVKSRLSPQEVEFYARTEAFRFSSTLAKYMSSLNNRHGLDLGSLRRPPQSNYVHVRCLQDVGTILTGDGHKLLLTKNSHHLMLTIDAESMVNAGLLECID